MSQAVGLTIDGVTYNVGIEYDSIDRSFELREGDGKGTSVTGRAIRDLIGTFYIYKLKVKPLPDNPGAYDSLYKVVSNFNNIHSITMPFGQSTITFDAYIDKGDDVYDGYYATYQRWDELDLTIEPIEPMYEAAPYVPPGIYILNYNANASDEVSNMPPQQTSGDCTFMISYKEPDRDDYVFRGWNTNISAQEPSCYPGDMFTVPSQQPGITNLYAIWRRGYTYRLNLYPNYPGTSYTHYSAKTTSTSYDFPITEDMTPTREGWRFLHWYTNSSGAGGQSYAIGEKVPMTSSSPTKNLYAIWDRDDGLDYSLVYDGNSHAYTVYGVPSTQYNSLPNFIISGNRPSQTGHAFLGWSRNAGATSAQYQPNDPINISNYTSAKTLTLYAIWQSNSFILRYDSNGGTGFMLPDSYDFPGSQMTTFIKRSEFERTGYTQVGWSNSAGDNNFVDYTLGSSIVLTAGEDKTIYAVWTNKKYTLMYSAGIHEDVVSNMPQSPQYSDNPAFAIPNITPTRPDAVFVGWCESSGGDGTIYKYGTENDTYTFNHTGVVTLYTIWQGSYKLYFQPNAGQDTVSNMPEENPQYSDNNQFTIRNYPNQPVRGDGLQYDFMGWADTSSATEPQYGWRTGLTPTVVVPSGSYNNNLYAVWARKDTTHKFELYYDANGGFSAPSLKTYFADTPTLEVDVDITSQPAYTGNTFLGWDTNKNATTPTYPKTTGGRITLSYESLTVLYAIWKAGTEYTLQYYPNASSVTNMPYPNPQTEDVPYFVTPNVTPERTGYAFKGWAPEGWQTGTQAIWQPGDTIELERVKIGGQFGTRGVVYAIWEVGSPTPTENTFTLQHNANNGQYSNGNVTYNKDGTPSSESSQSIAIARSYVPTRTGYTLVGWSDNGGDDNVKNYELNGSVSVDANTIKIIYAVWQKNNTFTLIHHANEGVYTYYGDRLEKPGEPSTQSYQDISIITSPVPQRGGYTLKGWSDTYGEHNSVNYPVNGSVRVNANTVKVIYAVWEEIETVNYTLYYDANGGRSAPASETHASPIFTISSSGPLRDPDETHEYAFAGWGLGRYSTTVSYRPGGTINITDHTQGTNLTLYAVWTSVARQYPATLIEYSTLGTFPGGATERTVSYMLSQTQEAKVIDTTVVPSVYGYNLIGWADEGSSVANYGINGMVTLTYGTPKKIYAMWESTAPVQAGDFTLEYNGNAGTDTVTNMPSPNPQFGTPDLPTDITITMAVDYSTTPRRAGYKFLGWSDNDGANNTVTYARGSSATVQRNVTKHLYAVWQRLYSVLYDPNGSNVSNMPYPNPHEEENVSNQVTPSLNPTRANYEFLGWDTDPEATEPYYWSEQTIEFPFGAYSVTLYAIWAGQLITNDHLKLTLRSLKEANPTEEWPFPTWNNNVMTMNGLTFTVNFYENEDDSQVKQVKSIVVNGTASAAYGDTVFKLTDQWNSEEQVTMISTDTITDFTCCPTGGSRFTYYASMTGGVPESTYTYYYDYGSGLEELPASTYWSFVIVITNGTVMNNVKFEPKWIDHDIDPFLDDEEVGPIFEG